MSSSTTGTKRSRSTPASDPDTRPLVKPALYANVSTKTLEEIETDLALCQAKLHEASAAARDASVENTTWFTNEGPGLIAYDPKDIDFDIDWRPLVPLIVVSGTFDEQKTCEDPDCESNLKLLDYCKHTPMTHPERAQRMKLRVKCGLGADGSSTDLLAVKHGKWVIEGYPHIKALVDSGSIENAWKLEFGLCGWDEWPCNYRVRMAVARAMMFKISELCTTIRAKANEEAAKMKE